MSFEGSDFILLHRFYKKSPRLFGRSVVNTLNTIAFESRIALLDTIREQMTVRDDRFVRSKMKVQTARGSDFRNAQSKVGSVAGPRFSGWIEKETGQKPETNRIATLLARGGSAQKKVRPKARAKTSNHFAKISDFQIKAKSRQHRLIIFLRMMTKQKRQFIMPRKFKGLRRGMYTVRRKKILLLQRFGEMKIKKDPWMKPTIQRELSNKDFRKAWAKNITRVLPKKLR